MEKQPTVIPGTYPILNSDLNVENSMQNVNFIWDSPVWYVSDYAPIFAFEENENGVGYNFIVIYL